MATLDKIKVIPLSKKILASGSDRNEPYQVLKRLRNKDVLVSNIQPYNGRIAWHITNVQFVLKQNKLSTTCSGILSYCSYVLAPSAVGYLIDDLYADMATRVLKMHLLPALE